MSWERNWFPDGRVHQIAQAPITELAWAAGFIDAEGYWGFHKTQHLDVAQVDRRPLDRLRRVCGAGHVRVKCEADETRNKAWYWHVTGATCRRFMLRIWPFMGDVKREQVSACYDPRDFRSMPLDNRKLTREEELAWCAGLFDGEGSTCCDVPGNCISLSVPQIHTGVLYRFKDIIGDGAVMLDVGASNGSKAKYKWRICLGALNAYRLIEPYLCEVKKEQFQAAYSNLRVRTRNPETKGFCVSGRHRMTEDNKYRTSCRQCTLDRQKVARLLAQRADNARCGVPPPPWWERAMRNLGRDVNGERLR